MIGLRSAQEFCNLISVLVSATARSPNKAVIEGKPRLIASSFLLVLHQSLSDRRNPSPGLLPSADRDGRSDVRNQQGPGTQAGVIVAML